MSKNYKLQIINYFNTLLPNGDLNMLRIVISKSQINLTPCHGTLTPFTSKFHILFISCSYFNDLHNNGCANEQTFKN